MRLIREQRSGTYRWNDTIVIIAKAPHSKKLPRAGYNRPKYKHIYDRMERIKVGSKIFIPCKNIQERDRVRLAIHHRIKLHRKHWDLWTEGLEVNVRREK